MIKNFKYYYNLYDYCICLHLHASHASNEARTRTMNNMGAG